ncbi:ABC transporter permease [Alteribacillus sp. HJP-4]|uniref:ABC transporter permease n=1 Tax=Alteribacillus sp. HJP-4 TaxID=2775394 RepID=UPI0035CCEE0D
MGSFFKKDLLIVWRDRKETIFSLIMPFVLIAILSFAMPGMIENPAANLEMNIAVVDKEEEENGLREFHESLQKKDLPEEAAASLKENSEGLAPKSILMSMLRNDDMQEWLSVTEVDEETAQQQLKEEEVDAVFTIPENFTYDSLNNMLLDEGDGAAISIIANNTSMHVDILEEMVDSLFHTMNLQSAVGHELGENANAFFEAEQVFPEGGSERLSGNKPLTAFQYFTPAMGIIFALFVSLTIVTKAAKEKRELVFERILLSNNNPLYYLSGKITSTFCFVFIQLTLLIGLCHVVFQLFPDRSLQFWLGIVVFVFLLAFFTAAMSALFTSIVFQMKSSDSALFLFTVVITAIGTVGGSFVPIYVLPDWLQSIGRETPNGFMLFTFIEWIQNDVPADLMAAIVKMMAYSVLLIGLGTWIFPARRKRA